VVCENELLLNVDNSYVIFIGTLALSHKDKNVTNIVVAGANPHRTHKLKSLGIILDSHLTFATHMHAVSKTCNYI